MAKKKRLDKYIVDENLVEDMNAARASIMAGEVLVDQQVVYKADFAVKEGQSVSLKEKFPYASRGALKIENAFHTFQVNVKGLRVLDIGISTGGFSDYMLQQGASQVVGVDVNIKQVDQQLRQQPNLTLIETNARTLTSQMIPIEPQLITMDVSFISITKVLPALSAFPKAKIVSLIKPQFEAKSKDVDKGGIVRDPEKRARVLLELKEKIQQLGYGITGFTSSGVKGRKGNREYFFLMQYGIQPTISDTIINHAIETEIEL